MNARIILSLAVVAAFATGAAAQTPSLTDLAKAEKARRAKVRATAGEVKTYSDGGTRPASDAAGTDETASPATAPAAAPAASSGKKEKTPEELAAERQKEWTEKVTQAQDQIKELDTQIATDERHLASMINITPARTDLANRIEANKKKLAELKQSLVSLEEERRKAGIPRPR